MKSADRHDQQQRLPGEHGGAERIVEPVGDVRVVGACSFMLPLRALQDDPALLRSPRALRMTARMMAAPEIAICQNGEMWITGRARLMTPRNSAPSTAPAHRADAAGDRDAADDAGRDHLQLVADRRLRPRR
jgi:hypothetical protein